MNTVFETRRIRLRMLVEKFGTVAQLNRELGWPDTNARLYQIHNRSIRSDRGTPYEMGDPTAREVETLLKLPVGWMDTPPTYAELTGENDRQAEMWLAMEGIPEDDWPTARRLLVRLKNRPKTAPQATNEPLFNITEHDK